MTKDEVIAKFCLLARLVMDKHGCKHAADCFCGMADPRQMFFTFDPFILKFMEEAVEEKLAKEKP